MDRGPGAVLLAVALLTPFGGKAHRKTEEGNRHYAAGEHELALSAYTEAQVDAPDAPELHYDIGNVLYRQGDYAGAAEAYSRALLSAEADLEPLAAYNLGNARFRQQDYRAAADAYRRALEADPADRDAKRNLELALQALAQQPEPPPQGAGESEPDEPQASPQPQPSPSPQGEQEGGRESPESESQPAQGQQSERPAGAEREQEMTREQAERLLDGLAEAERENLKREAGERVSGRGKRPEKDW